MKKLYYILFATAGLFFTGCANEDIVLNDAKQSVDTESPIVFGSLKQGVTRADITGAEAADLLGKQFVVSGYKGTKTATVGNIVFDNYLVKYAENTANTTQSNTTNWEYVGVDRIKHAIDNGITSQQIKYWDYSQPQYDFIAWSTGSKTAIYEGTPGDGEVLVSAITPSTIGSKAYTFEGKAKDLKDCYIADLVTVKKSEYGDNPVTFKFRSLGSKVRIAIYETVPGYSVKNVQFYSAAASNDADAAKPRLFTTEANNIYTQGIYTVTYPTVDDPSNADNNQAHVSFAGTGTQSTVVDFGAMNLVIAEEGEKTAGAVFIGRSSNTASYAGEAEGNYYTQYLPNEAGTNLNLRVNYTLESIDGSGEEITVKGATAQVPLIYTQWKAGFAYTYLFKISDKTNGYTGAYDPTQPDNTTVNSDPAGLYPITFDAVVVNAEDNADKTQETITLVSTPSITSYQKGSTVINNNEYVGADGPIFVTVNDGTSATTPDLANGKLVELTTTNAALYTIPAGKTEAEVIDALQMQASVDASGNITGRSGLVLNVAANDIVTSIEYGVDGNAIDLTSKSASALKFTGSAGTYAFVYTKTAPTATTDKYQPVTKAAGVSVDGFHRNVLVAAPAGDVQKGVKYFPKDDATEGMITPFLGQGVGNLYLDAAGNTIASGYAVTGTDYYYTVDNGMTYKKATNIAYEAFESTTLYTDPACTTAKTETSPVDGQAYYDATGAYCVILPQQTTGLFVIDDANYVACGSTDIAVNGIVYFDKYSQNDGVYYTKVIKVQ